MEIEGRRNKKAKTTDCMATNNNVNKSAGSREEQMETGDTSNIDENTPTKSRSTDTDESSKLPEIFQTETLTMEERWNVIFWEILPDRKPFEVEQAFHYYVMDNAMDGDWDAVWRSHQVDCDILVEVKEICKHALTATVELDGIMPFCCESEDGVGKVSQSRVEEVLQSSKHKVALTELYPVFEDSGDLDNTAMALEHLRFFYEYCWRLSDEGDDGDHIYAQRDLEQRMKLYYDVKDKNVPPAVVEKYNKTMAEYQQKYWSLKLKRAQFDPDSDDEEDDDGPEIPVVAMVEMTQLCEDLEILMKTLEKLEDPVMRSIYMKGLKKKGGKAQISSEQRHSRPNQEVITHIVAEKLTVALIKSLDLDDSTVIEHHTNPKSALETSYNGDTILLFPGRYSGEAFYNLSQSVNIKGIGSSPSEVIIACQENVSIFVDCTAYRLSISNVTFEQDDKAFPSFATLDVRSGTTTLTNCVFKPGRESISVSREGTLIMDQCEIQGSENCGIFVCGGASLSLTNSHIHHCGSGGDTSSAMFNCGLGIQVTEGTRLIDQSMITLTNNRFENNKGPGVWIEIYVDGSLEGKSKPKNLASDDAVAGLLPPNTRLEAKDNVFSKNCASGDDDDDDTAIRVQYQKLSSTLVFTDENEMHD